VAGEGTLPPRIWVEVDDFLRYFDGSLTPTGIGRVQAEIFPHLAARHADRISFVRFGGDSRTVSLLDWREVRRLADGNDFLSKHGDRSRTLPARRLLRYLSRRAAVRLRELRRPGDLRRFEEAVRPGDVLLNIGASWTHHGFGETVGELRRRHGMRFALLVHDLLPLTHPQFVSPRHIPGFTRWLGGMADVLDIALTPSRASADALRDWLDATGRPLPPICPVPFGAGFPSSAGGLPVPAPAERRHVLYVSTIEVRKNHMLLFRVWERLIAAHGAEAVPPLVFAGKYGWEIDELKAALARTGFLGGKIQAVQNLTDGQLADLYRQSHFTVFPSFCEGWGLPVAESLLYGRFCIASDATSIPEVGGRFLDYHDPSDVDAAHRLVERALFEPGYLAERERSIAADYRPPGWAGTAAAIVAALDRHLAFPAG
jgi:glycosyltransferase involved in cell wall biosynthesis